MKRYNLQIYLKYGGTSAPTNSFRSKRPFGTLRAYGRTSWTGRRLPSGAQIRPMRCRCRRANAPSTGCRRRRPRRRALRPQSTPPQPPAGRHRPLSARRSLRRRIVDLNCCGVGGETVGALCVGRTRCDGGSGWAWRSSAESSRLGRTPPSRPECRCSEQRIHPGDSGRSRVRPRPPAWSQPKGPSVEGRHRR